MHRIECTISLYQNKTQCDSQYKFYANPVAVTNSNSQIHCMCTLCDTCFLFV